MANGRQRKRDVLLAKKAAEQAARDGLAGLSPEGLTSIVSNDSNDLDNISYSTTDGATVNIKNNRIKDSVPTTNVLGGRKGYMPGNQVMEDELILGSNLGGRKGYMPGSTNSQGPSTNFRSSDPSTYFNVSQGPNSLARTPNVPNFNSQDPNTYRNVSEGPNSLARSSFEDELLLSSGPNVRGSARPQAKAITEFIGEDLSPATNQFYTVDIDSADDLTLQQDDSVIGETLNDDGTVTYELAPINLGEPIVTTSALTKDEKLPGLYDNVAPGKETALTPTIDNTSTEQAIMHDPSDAEMATHVLTMEEQLKEEELLRQLEKETRESNANIEGSTTIDGEGSLYNPDNQSVGILNNEVKPDAKLTEGSEAADSEITAADNHHLFETANNIHENEPGSTPPEVVVEEIEAADNEITAATAGNHHLFEIANGAKGEVEKVKEEVENGAITVEDAKEKIKSSLGQLGELLGIDGKDLVRALFRYAGGRIFGMSGNEAGKFMYEGFMADEVAEAKVEAAKLENMGLGTGATAQQKNLKAYKEEIKRIDNDASLSAEEKVAAKKTANEVFGVNKPTSMGRPINIKGIMPDGTEEIVVGRRNDNNSYDVFMNDKWVPLKLSGLTDVQVTSRGAEQAFERGVVDPRNDIGIDNAVYVSSGGVPAFKHKTESERKSYQLAKRAVDNYPIVDAMMKDPEMLEHITSAMGGLQTYAAGNANSKITAASINLAIGDSIPQKYRSATQAWLQSLLRADTGAAYSETEIMDYIATNIPQVGDLPDTVAFKIAQMKSTTETMAANAGQGAKYLLGRLEGSVEPPESVKRLQALGISTKTESSDGSGRSTELEEALANY
jgi:hypothetical protein